MGWLTLAPLLLAFAAVVLVVSLGPTALLWWYWEKRTESAQLRHPDFKRLWPRVLLALGFARCHHCKRLRRLFVMWYMSRPIAVTCWECFDELHGKYRHEPKNAFADRDIGRK